MPYTKHLIAYLQASNKEELANSPGFWRTLFTQCSKEEIQFIQSDTKKTGLIEILRYLKSAEITAVLEKFERYNLNPVSIHISHDMLLKELFANKHVNIADMGTIQQKLLHLLSRPKNSTPTKNDLLAESVYTYKLYCSDHNFPALSQEIYDALILASQEDEVDYHSQEEIIKILSLYNVLSYEPPALYEMWTSSTSPSSILNLWFFSSSVELEKKREIINIFSPLNADCNKILLHALWYLLNKPQNDELLEPLITKMTANFSAVGVDPFFRQELFALLKNALEGNSNVHQAILNFILEQVEEEHIIKELEFIVHDAVIAPEVIRKLLSYADRIYSQQKNIPIKIRHIIWSALTEAKAKMDDFPLLAIAKQLKINTEKNEILRNKTTPFEILATGLEGEGAMLVVLTSPITVPIALGLTVLNPLLKAIYNRTQNNALLALLRNCSKADFIRLLNIYTEKQAYVLAEAFVNLSVVNKEFASALEEMKPDKDAFKQELISIVIDYYGNDTNPEKSTTGAAAFIFYFFIHLADQDPLLAKEQCIQLLITRALRIKNQARGNEPDKATNILYRKIYEVLCRLFDKLPRELHELYNPSKPDDDQVELYEVTNGRIDASTPDNPFIQLHLKIVAKLLEFTKQDRRMEQIHLIEWYKEFLINFVVEKFSPKILRCVSHINEGIARMQLQSLGFLSRVTQKSDQNSIERKQFIMLCESCVQEKRDISEEYINWFRHRVNGKEATAVEVEKIAANESLRDEKLASLYEAVENAVEARQPKVAKKNRAAQSSKY
jgi:hypothetical protein